MMRDGESEGEMIMRLIMIMMTILILIMIMIIIMIVRLYLLFTCGSFFLLASHSLITFNRHQLTFLLSSSNFVVIMSFLLSS